MRDMFTRQLLQFPGLTAPKALEIAARFPTALRCLFSLLLKADCLLALSIRGHGGPRSIR